MKETDPWDPETKRRKLLKNPGMWSYLEKVEHPGCAKWREKERGEIWNFVGVERKIERYFEENRIWGVSEGKREERVDIDKFILIINGKV